MRRDPSPGRLPELYTVGCVGLGRAGVSSWRVPVSSGPRMCAVHRGAFSPFVTRGRHTHARGVVSAAVAADDDPMERVKLKGWMFSSMDFDGETLRVKRPPTGRTELPLAMVEGFHFANAAVGQPGLRVVVRGGSIHQTTPGVVRVSDDPYLLPLTPGRKKRQEAQDFADLVMAARAGLE